MKTYERVKIAKNYIENKYKIKKADEENKKKEWEEIYMKLDKLNLDVEDKSTFRELILQEEAKLIRESRKKITIFQFEPLKIIGRGAFGEVRLCRDKETNEIVAVKKMKKTEMHKKNQVLHVKAEQEVLAKNQSEWVVKLKYSFQDDEYLYLVMEYLPGGDLMSLLMNNDIIPEDQAKLYIAEMVLAIEAVHDLKCIHRDIKPDNILIDKDGHIKLSDFGLSRKADNFLYADNPVELKNAYSHIPGISNIAAKYSDHYNNRKRKRIFAFSTFENPVFKNLLKFMFLFIVSLGVLFGIGISSFSIFFI
jgi:serine/threonine kinase 38